MSDWQRFQTGRKDTPPPPVSLAQRENSHHNNPGEGSECESCHEKLPALTAMGGKGFSHEFSRVKPGDAQSFSSSSMAMAKNGKIHLAPGAEDLPATQIQRLLAHERIHVAQQMGVPGRIPAGREELEGEAHDLAPQLLAGRSLAPIYASLGDMALFDTPVDKIAVERARKRLALLKRFYDEYVERESRRLRIESGRDPLLKKRRAMDRDMPVPAPPDRIEAAYGGQEESIIAALNRKALQVEVTENSVRFHLRLHVRFEGKSRDQAKGDFETLQKNFRAGVQLIWNQRLSGMPLSGRDFEVVPEMTLIDSNAPRDENFWLVSVRPTDKGPITYEGKPVTDMPAPKGAITSVTNALLAGGVMSIPPLHITMPDVLGHELLHMFGLVDRYMIQQIFDKKGGSKLVNVPMRETRGRPDPLGAQTGKVLPEDLNFLFEKLGVYQADENRGLEELQKLERAGYSLQWVLGEIHRQEEIIQLGHDPNSLIRERKDFRDKILKSAEDL